MKTDELREKYLAFFESKGHVRKPSDVLVPTWDPSVLFTPAGMNQFKDHFLGKVKLEFTRATTCQKCLRTGDIDNVGRTAYHHTFFEMLGNFSFGDYFKREAIHWAWEFLTSPKWLGLPTDRLSVTVYLDDDEAANIWQQEIGLSPDRIERMGEDDNFWPASAPSKGPDGVCGPCSEIFFHPAQGKSVEIWNLVFTQFNRVGQPPNNLRPLPSKNIDTGMGLERCASVLQGVETNFHIDILLPIVQAAAEVCGVTYEPNSDHGRRLRRITDHVRACALAIHENVNPGNKEERYVIRRLLRRAVLDGRLMGLHDPFLFQLVPAVADSMRVPYPELRSTVERVQGVIRKEEENFFGTIDAGLAHIDRIFGDMQSASRAVVRGEDAARLYQTYGVPPELLEQLAAERNFTFDWNGFRLEMEKHGDVSGSDQFVIFKTGPIEALKKALHQTTFVGYETEETEVEFKGIVAQDHLCDELTEVGHDRAVTVVLDRTPFYGESGGQVGDSGEIVGQGFRFRVTDTQKDGDLILHLGHLVEGRLRAGAKGRARVDAPRRQGIRRAHSATHILHYALQKNLGRHAQQQGSKVDEDWLRFDFAHLSPLSSDEVTAVERDVQTQVAAAAAIDWKYVPLGEARKAGAMMLFGEKYPDPVRLVSMGEFSRELCGGTHLANTREVGAFEVVVEEGVAAGTRRIVALTGAKAEAHASQVRATLEQAAARLGCAPLDVPATVRSLVQHVRELRKLVSAGGRGTAEAQTAPARDPNPSPAYAQLRQALRETARLLNVALFDVPSRLEALQGEATSLTEQLTRLAAAGAVSAESLLAQGETIGATRVVVAETPGANSNLMRQLIDQLRKSTPSVAVMLVAGQDDGKVTLVAGLTRDLVEAGQSAGKWVGEVAPVVGGGGGGKPDMAQAGGKDASRIPAALAQARTAIRAMLQA
ncbi:MAG: alanine--tRNA ligase [Pirellulales bacterium]